MLPQKYSQLGYCSRSLQLVLTLKYTIPFAFDNLQNCVDLLIMCFYSSIDHVYTVATI
jgi:hypothetical protein